MKRTIELDAEDMEEAVRMWLKQRGHVKPDAHMAFQLCTNGRAPEPDPPHAREDVRVWAIVTVDEKSAPRPKAARVEHTCPECRGSGDTPQHNFCSRCNGNGTIP